jgi:hypothetical protein
MKVTVTVELRDVTITLPLEVSGADNPIFTGAAAREALATAGDFIEKFATGAYGDQRKGGVYVVKGAGTDA